MYHMYKRKNTRKRTVKLEDIQLEETRLNISKFLSHVGLGEQHEAEEMLKQNAYLCFEYGNLIDCSKREFKNITGFQYALWALDFHMWNMILKYLPDKQAKLQVSFFKSRKDEQIFCDWQHLINALQKYIDNHDVWNYDKLKSYWSSVIGGAQLLLPAHVINEYHNPLRSLNCFVEDTYRNFLPRLGVNLWVNLMDTNGLAQLGKNFAWTRGNNEIALSLLIPNTQCLYTSNLLKSEEIDKNYLQSLLSFRKEQVNMLICLMSCDIMPPRLSL